MVLLDRLHVTLPADILINTGENKMPPILSSQQHNGLIASIYVERNEIQRFKRCFTCAFKRDITTSASARFFFSCLFSDVCVYVHLCAH